MSLRLTDLKNFVEVANASTMREAAAQLGITQPSLSESIKRLENDLNEVLFYRSRSGVSLTPGGNRAFKKAKEMLLTLSELERENSEADDQRVITVGCHQTVASYCLPRALKSMQAQAPRYRIRLKHDLSRAILFEIQQGRIDIGIIVNPVPSPDLIIKPIAKDEVCVWQNSSAGLPTPDKVFCNLGLIQTQAILRKWKIRPSSIIETESLELIVRLTREGLGYGIIPTRAVGLFNGAHCKQVPNTPSYQDTIAIVYRPEFGRHPTERLLIENLKRSAR